MTKILAIDLGKFKSVTCLLKTETNETEFWTMSTDRQYLLAVLKNYDPDLVVIESCGLAGWVHDACTEKGYQVLVCNPNQEAWKWKNVKRKTDRDECAQVGQAGRPGATGPRLYPVKAATRVSSAREVPPGASRAHKPGAEQHPGHLCPARDAHGAWPEGVGLRAV